LRVVDQVCEADQDLDKDPAYQPAIDAVEVLEKLRHSGKRQQ